jgi:hypothetical protein
MYGLMDDAHILSFTESVCLLSIQLIRFILTGYHSTLSLDEAVQSYQLLPLDDVVIPVKEVADDFGITWVDVHRTMDG